MSNQLTKEQSRWARTLRRAKLNGIIPTRRIIPGPDLEFDPADLLQPAPLETDLDTDFDANFLAEASS